MVAYVLVPNRHLSHIAWHSYHGAAIKQTMFDKGQEVDKPLVSFLLSGSPSHNSNALWVPWSPILIPHSGRLQGADKNALVPDK